jgi:hypothetical protein
MMRLLREFFVRNNGDLLSERQQKTCSRMINSPTISERARNFAIALFGENAKAQAAGDVLDPRMSLCCSCVVDGSTCDSNTILMNAFWSKSFEEPRFENYCRANARSRR